MAVDSSGTAAKGYSIHINIHAYFLYLSICVAAFVCIRCQSKFNFAEHLTNTTKNAQLTTINRKMSRTQFSVLTQQNTPLSALSSTYPHTLQPFSTGYAHHSKEIKEGKKVHRDTNVGGWREPS